METLFDIDFLLLENETPSQENRNQPNYLTVNMHDLRRYEPHFESKYFRVSLLGSILYKTLFRLFH